MDEHSLAFMQYFEPSESHEISRWIGLHVAEFKTNEMKNKIRAFYLFLWFFLTTRFNKVPDTAQILLTLHLQF